MAKQPAPPRGPPVPSGQGWVHYEDEPQPPAKTNGHHPLPVAAEEVFHPPFIAADDLAAKSFPPLRWIITDVLPVGLAILAGKSKIGKSWLALDIALTVAAGGMLFGQLQCHQCEVLYLALEDGERRLKGRMLKILGSESLAPGGCTFATQWKQVDLGGMELLAAFLDANPGCRLVIIDTLGRVRGKPDGQRGSYQQDYDDVGALKTFADLRGVCILLVHHTRKMAADDVFDLVSGTTGVVGAADTLMVLTRQRNDAVGEFAITGRDIIEDGTFALRFDKETGRWSWLGKADEVKSESEQGKVFACLKAATEPMTAADIAEETGISRNTVKVSLTRLKQAMRVEHAVERGKWRSFGSAAKA